MKVLYTSAEVREAIIDLFSSAKGRRVAITAFVGDGAEAYLPRLEGLELICWPKAGGTNPHELRKLMKSGVQVYFADSLHMKVYWTEDRGAIITSANLSTNALGAGNLTEIGVLLEYGEVDIDRIISTLKTRSATRAELQKLDRLHNLYATRNRDDGKTKSPMNSFSEWYESPLRSEWKLGWWDAEGCDLSLSAKGILKKEYPGIAKPAFLGNVRRGDFVKGDWMLYFYLKEEKPTQIGWKFADFVVPVSSSDKNAYTPEFPYQVVQIWPLKRYPSHPFRDDTRFKSAFKKAVREFGAMRIKELKSLKPSAHLIDLIHDYYIDLE